MKGYLSFFALSAFAISSASITRIELTPTDVGSGDGSVFTAYPTLNPALYLGEDYGAAVRMVNFNTAPDGALSEGGTVTTQYASFGVTMNSIRISDSIYGGNNYGTGFAAEHDLPQIYSFSAPVVAVGIINTSPDHDRIRFYSGVEGTGDLLDDFIDQDGEPLNFNVDRFVGGKVASGPYIRSFVVSNEGGNLELDELIFAFAPVPEPSSLALLGLGAFGLLARRKK